MIWGPEAPPSPGSLLEKQNQEGVEIEYGRNGRTSSPADSKTLLKCENKWSDSIVYATQFQNLIEKILA